MQEIFQKMALLGDVWVLWLLIAASVWSLGVIIERWKAFRGNSLDFPKFLDELSKKLENGDITGARQVARGVNGVEARVVMAGLSNYSKGPVAVEESMTSKLVMERSHLEKNLIILGTLGNNAPFVGLFGTVLGIIKAFHDLGVSGGGGASVVMAGVSSALIATAFGIFVAIPAVAANNFFYTRLKRIVANSQSLIHLMQVHAGEERRRRSDIPTQVLLS